MSGRAGHNPGHDEAGPPPGYTWADYLASLIEAHGTLTAVAWKLLERGDGPEDVASVERALRRLRMRGQQDGGSWGVRLLRVFGVPATVAARLRWMGVYHSPFNDLPRSLCLDQLRVWDRPPLSASRARLWLHLGLASCALRGRDFEGARAQLERARTALAHATADDGAAAARIELALVSAYALGHDSDGAGAVVALLDAAEAALADGGGALSAADAACFGARIVDQRAYLLNRRGESPAHAQALALYETLPRADLHPFASYRRDAGLAYGYLRTGRGDEALACALRACEHAGDGGYTRLRVMGLLLQARVLGRDGGAARDAVLGRARAIAARLEDDELLGRVERAEGAR